MKSFKLLYLSASIALVGCGGSDGGGNSAPVFAQSSYQLSVDEDSAAVIDLSASDADNDSLTYSLNNAAGYGQVSIATSGEVTYTPNPNFNGADSFAISVTDGEATATASVSVTVNPVNDLPVFTQDFVVVSGNETKVGQIQATDVDNDELSFTLVEGAQRGALTVSPSGEVSYSPEGLIDIDDDFTVSVSDGEAEVTATLKIRTNAASNTDRAYYYYSSDYSHLRQAENLLPNLQSDSHISLINSNLAVAYARSGLLNKVEQLLNADAIPLDQDRALAMVGVANQYIALGKLDLADQLRQQARDLYGRYVAAKGTNAFDSDDVDFYDALSSSYFKQGKLAEADSAFSILDSLFKQSNPDNATSVQRTFFAFRDVVEGVIENWQSTNDSTTYALAESMSARLQRYANLMPPRLVKNNRNGNEGKLYDSVRAVALMDVVKSYINLNQEDNAKSALADIFALYGVVNYDPEFPRQASVNAAVNLVEYEYGLGGQAESFVTLYPDADMSPIVDAFVDGSFWKERFIEDADEARLVAKARSMSSEPDAALALITEAADSSNLRQYFTQVVAFNRASPGLAVEWRKQGNYHAVKQALTLGLSILTSAEYMQQNLASYAFTVGQTGCEMLINEALLSYRLSGDDELYSVAQQALNSCVNIALSDYASGQDGSAVELVDSVKANGVMLQFANQLQLPDQRQTLLDNIDRNLEQITSFSDRLLTLRSLGGWSAQGELYDLAQGYYNQGIAVVNAIEANAQSEEVGSATNDFFGDKHSMNYRAYLRMLEQDAGLNAGYPAAIANARQTWLDIVNTRLSELVNKNVVQKATYLPKYAYQLLRIRAYDQVRLIAQNDALGTVERNAILTELAVTLSARDDFPHTPYALVDSDGDGKPNFFTEVATAADIEASGLVLDEDSDGDGVADEDDRYPLDAERH